ncbi:MAG: right-handed parallel beta-helix repeat-containing protein [Gammaproteobacteria bacterium]|nr:right-handed parallel beta-helix repeat-containing protein [Gammaproteobacteria bacterium]
MHMHAHAFPALLAAALLAGCEPVEQTPPAPPPSAEEAFRLQVETASPGTVIEVPAGTLRLQRGLVLNTDGVTIRGAGMDQSILSFKGQLAGAEGLLVTASDFTIEDLAIEDTAGDALKITDGRNITVRRVRTEWTGGPSAENGAYGIYPVQTENTLIEGAVAIGASDAGIYVGQSRNVVVRDSRAEFNVAGIEIENTVHADVFGNLAANNTGGILIFNMPDLPEEGHSTRVFNNRVVDNNTANFGIPGSAVAGVPAGSGILINANDRVEVFDNEIRNNQTANVLISSYFSANYTGEQKVLETFDPYPETLLIRGNTFGPGGGAPDHEGLEAVRLALFGAEGHLPDVVWDGVRHPQRTAAEFAICVDNAPADLLNVDGANGYASPSVVTSEHQCSHPRLVPVELAGGAA